MKSEEFYRICWKTQNAAPPQSPRRVEEQSEEAPSNSPKGGESKAVGSEK